MNGLSRSTRNHLVARQRYGMAHGEHYVSPLEVRELPKVGRVHRLTCARFAERPFALRSDTEFCVFLEQYFREEVIDIRPHVPSVTSRTLAIAARSGLRHPGGLTNPDVLLADFVVTVQSAEAVTEQAIVTRHAETGSTASFETECALLEAYWAECGAAFSVCYRDGLNGALARNLLWLFPIHEQIVRAGVTRAQQRAQTVLLDEVMHHDHYTMREACRSAACRGALAAGASVLALRQLLATRLLVVDLTMPDLFCLPPAAFVASASNAMD